jgi:apolipoprotein N-acyltransferase
MQIASGPKTYRVATPICYEGAFERVCRPMVMENGKKTADILLNMSSDGWFVYRGQDGQWKGSTEHMQHLVQYCFRAIENRVPVVRAVNTGISASIDSNGRLLAEISQHGKREMVAGTLLLKDNAKAPADVQIGPQVLVDSRVSLYSLVGDVFPALVCAVAIGSFAWITMKRRKQTQGASK